MRASFAVKRQEMHALRSRYLRWAKSAGCTKAEVGAVTGVQRFGSSLNVHVHPFGYTPPGIAMRVHEARHFHTLVVDGVHIEGPDGALRFVPGPLPTRATRSPPCR